MRICQEAGWPELKDHRCLPGWWEVKGCPVWDLIVYWWSLRWVEGSGQCQEGPTSPQEGCTWRLVSHHNSSYINPYMSTECHHGSEMCWNLRTPRKNGASSTLPRREGGRILHDLWGYPQPMTGGDLDLKQSVTRWIFHSSFRAQHCGTRKQCSPDQLLMYETVVSILEAQKEEKQRRDRR